MVNPKKPVSPSVSQSEFLRIRLSVLGRFLSLFALAAMAAFGAWTLASRYSVGLTRS
jgi:hypothetical protein